MLPSITWHPVRGWCAMVTPWSAGGWGKRLRSGGGSRDTWKLPNVTRLEILGQIVLKPYQRGGFFNWLARASNLIKIEWSVQEIVEIRFTIIISTVDSWGSVYVANRIWYQFPQYLTNGVRKLKEAVIGNPIVLIVRKNSFDSKNR